MYHRESATTPSKPFISRNVDVASKPNLGYHALKHTEYFRMSL